MKRAMLAIAVLVASVGALGSAGAHECLTVGEYNRATTSFTDSGNTIKISTEMLGGALTDSVVLCNEDPFSSTQDVYGSQTIEVNGVVVCDRDDVRMSADPFGFGSGSRPEANNRGTCGADLSFAEIGSAPSDQTVSENGPSEHGTKTGVSRTTGVTGSFWFSGYDSRSTVPAGTTAVVTRGMRVKIGADD